MGWRGILGFEYGVVQAPLGVDVSCPELVAAVANAGCLGFLRAPDWEDRDYLRGLIRKTRSLTDKPFGVGVVLAFPHEETIKVILEERIAVLWLFWGDVSKELVDDAHRFGVKVVSQIGSIESAKQAIDAGVDAITVQGVEAGGHVIGHESLITLLPKVVDLVKGRNITVIAAGGIADARGYVAALALGADGVALGTRFVATEESNAHPLYKQKLVELDKTEHTNVFGRARWPNAPQRTLATDFFKEWRSSLAPDDNEVNQPIIGHAIIHDREREVRRFAGMTPNKFTTGDIESMVMYAGQGVSLIKEILPASQVVKNLVEGAQQWIEERFEYIQVYPSFVKRHNKLKSGAENKSLMALVNQAISISLSK